MPQATKKAKYARGNTGPERTMLIAAVVVLLVLLCIGVAVAVFFTPGGNTELVLPQQISFSDVMVPLGTKVEAARFVWGLEGTDIAVAYETEPDWNLAGEQTVTLRLSRDRKTCSRQVKVHLFLLNSHLTVGLSDTREITAMDFAEHIGADKLIFVGTQPHQADRTNPGKTPLKLMLLDGSTYDVVLEVVDDVPPKAQGVEITFADGMTLDPAALVTGITDHSAVTVTFAEPPQINTTGKHTVKLLLTDAAGNTAVVESVVNVPALLVEPGFTGISTIYIQVGDTISYKSGVKATDPQDGELPFTVDNSLVDRTKEGIYYALYSVTDADGNTVTVQRKVVVEDITRAVVERYAQKALDKILKAGMTRDQQIQAIFRYTMTAVKFVGTSNKTSIEHGAYEGLTSGKGDCYTYYAMNVIFFEMLGIENLEVTRVGGSSHHWWNLVQFEDGMYYHVDSCPVYQQVPEVNHGKMTLRDLATYTNHPGVVDRRPNFYVYDQNLPIYQGITVAP